MNNTKKVLYRKMQKSSKIATISGAISLTNLFLTTGFAAIDTPAGVSAAIICTFGTLISGFACCIANNYSRYYETKLDETYIKKEKN